jgi:ATP-dependent Clp protease ATP-binding subunit ClpA
MGTTTMFERFTEKSIKVIMLAQEESRRLGHNQVGTEQLLLGTIGEGTGIGAKVLHSMGITLETARIEVEKIIGRGDASFTAVELPLTEGAGRALELCLVEARRLGHNCLGTGHLLLGLILQSEGTEDVAAKVLENLGVDSSNIRDRTTQMIADRAPSQSATIDPEENSWEWEDYSSGERLRQRDRSQSEDYAMFERFTEKSIKVIMLAQEESRRLGHNQVGTEQILLGMIGEGTGIAAKVLKSMGVNLKAARIEVEKIIGRGSGFVSVEIPFTPRAKRVLEMSLEEARQLGHNYLGTEHQLLGLVRESEGLAVRVLENLGVDVSDIPNQIIRMLGESAEPPSVTIHTEANIWEEERSLEDEDLDAARWRERRRRDRSENQDPLAESETKIMLQSILDRTIAIDRSINEMRAEIVAVSDRVARIEERLSPRGSVDL